MAPLDPAIRSWSHFGMGPSRARRLTALTLITSVASSGVARFEGDEHRALGDLALAGAPILGRYEGYKAGRAMTNALLRTLFARPNAVEMVECDEEIAARLPGVGLTRHDAPLLAA